MVHRLIHWIWGFVTEGALLLGGSGGFKCFFSFSPIWGKDPIWRICFNWVGSTTNSYYLWLTTLFSGWTVFWFHIDITSMVFLWVSPPKNFRIRIPRQFFRMGIPPETFICHDCLVSNSPMTFAQHSQHNNRDHQITHFGGNKQCKCMFFGVLHCLQQRMVFRMIYVKDSLQGFLTTNSRVSDYQTTQGQWVMFFIFQVFSTKNAATHPKQRTQKGQKHVFIYIYIYI